LNEYGIIYIQVHGNPKSIVAFELCVDDDITYPWLELNESDRYDRFSSPGGTWFFYYKNFLPDDWETRFPDYLEKAPLTKYTRKCLGLTKYFFERQNYNNSIVYISACQSWGLKNIFLNNGAKVYLGHSDSNYSDWGGGAAYRFFNHMIENAENVKASYDLLRDPTLYDPLWNPDHRYSLGEKGYCWLYLDTHSGEYDETYFPAPITIIVQEQ